MKQYFQIGEIAKLYGIGTDSIRYYEELGIINPARAANGYRIYSVGDIWRLNVIRDLRMLDFSMDRICDYLNDRSVDSTIDILGEELGVIGEKLNTLRRQRDNVRSRLSTIIQARNRPEGMVCRERFPHRRCHAIHQGYQTDEEMDVLIQQLLGIDPRRMYIIGNNRIGSRLSGEAVSRNRFREYDSVFIIDDQGEEIIQGGDYLSTSYRGSCEQNAHYVPVLLEYAAKHRLRLVDGILELLLIDVHESREEREHTTELQVRVVPMEEGE